VQVVDWEFTAGCRRGLWPRLQL